MFALPELKPNEIIMYLRKSRTDDPALTISETVAKHEQMLDEWCTRNLCALIPESNRFREIVSGETIEARPEIKRVLRLCELNQYKAILIVEPQRLSRGDLEDIGRISKILRYTNTLVITLQYTYDISDERDRDYFERELKRGNEYLEYSKRILHNGRQASAQSGFYIGSVAPFGYRKTFVKIGKKNAPTLEPIPEEAAAVRMIFEMYVNGHGAGYIISALNAAGIKPKAAEDWQEISIFKILENPHYIGLIRYNYRKTVRTVAEGEIKARRPKSKEPSLYPGLHPAIIDKELFERAQEQRKARFIPPTHSNQVLSNPLAGLVYCECGFPMLKTSPAGGRKPRLICKHQKECGNISAILADVVAAVVENLQSALASESITAKEQNHANAAHEQAEMLKNRLSALQKKQDRLWEQLAEGMPRDTFDRLISSVNDDISAAQAALDRAMMLYQSESAKRDQERTLAETLEAMNNPAFTPGEKNKFLKSVISRITYSRRKGENFRLSVELKF